MSGLLGRLRRLLEHERLHHGILPRPDYDALGQLADGWEEIWESLLAQGGGSGVVRTVVAGIRDPRATERLRAYALQRGQDLLLRTAAVIAIGRTGSSAADDLLLELGEADLPIRGVALRELARRRSAWGGAALRAQLDGTDPAAVTVAAALALYGDRAAVEVLLDRLREHQDGVAGAVLGELGVAAAVGGLLGLLYDDHAATRLSALAALGQIGDPRAVPWMLGCLADEAEDVADLALEMVDLIAGRRPAELRPATAGFEDRCRSWWRQARRGLVRRWAYRQGRPRSLGDWFDDLAGAWRSILRPELCDTLVMRLEAATGEVFGFDAWLLDAAANRAHLRDLATWWEVHRERFPAGGWYWQGQRLADPVTWT